MDLPASLPDPAEHAEKIGRGDPPEGFAFAWRDEIADGYLGWRAVDPGAAKQCRWDSTSRTSPRCEAAAVAELNRSSETASRPRWWAYCADHLYGRLWHEGRIYGLVLRRLEDEEATS